MHGTGGLGSSGGIQKLVAAREISVGNSRYLRGALRLLMPNLPEVTEPESGDVWVEETHLPSSPKRSGELSPVLPDHHLLPDTSLPSSEPFLAFTGYNRILFYI